jgi:O-acetylserine/cysteine efflux transporter
LIAFDPNILDEIIGTFLVFGMAFFYGLSQVFSRYIKDLDVKFTNSFMGLGRFYNFNYFLSNIRRKYNRANKKS